MAIVGKFIKGALKLNNRFKSKADINISQINTLFYLLKTAENTSFGKEYRFSNFSNLPNFVKEFQKRIPITDYDNFHSNWLYRCVNGERNVTWPGSVSYFALSSGTSGAPSKKIPITNDMLEALRKGAYKHFTCINNLDVPDNLFTKKMLLLGGSTHLATIGNAKEGDLSGIMTEKLPFWLNYFHKPEKEIKKEKDWNLKIDKMVENAPKWDIACITGVPSWSQLLIEKIIKRYNLNHIHEIWPDFKILVHGGVSFEPYKSSFKKLLGQEIIYMETYLSSEGFIAYKEKANSKGMTLLLDNGIFFEFIPFDKTNFNSNGELISQNPETHLFSEIVENQEYAIILSTCAGLWRYMLGDTVMFHNNLLKITGRTKHFISLCGEHLSVDNMNKAITLVNEKMNLFSREFTVAGITEGVTFKHIWYIGCENKNSDVESIKTSLDAILQNLNDDYKTERDSGLLQIEVLLVSNQLFYDFLEQNSTIGAQTKFPRVIGNKHELWVDFIQKSHVY